MKKIGVMGIVYLFMSGVVFSMQPLSEQPTLEVLREQKVVTFNKNEQSNQEASKVLNTQELLREIYSYLNAHDRKAFKSVCSYFYNNIVCGKNLAITNCIDSDGNLAERVNMLIASIQQNPQRWAFVRNIGIPSDALLTNIDYYKKQLLAFFFQVCRNVKIDLSKIQGIREFLLELPENTRFSAVRHITGFQDIPAEVMAKIFRVFPNLEEVDLSYNDEALNGILELQDDVKFLIMKKLSLYNVGLSVEAIAKIFKIFPNIEEVNLPWTEEVANGMLHISDDVSFLRMKKLSLEKTGILVEAMISAEAIAKIFGMFPNLEQVDLSSICLGASNGIFQFLKDANFLKLKTLSLNDSKLSVKAIAKIFRVFPNLKEVHLCGNSEVANWILQLSNDAKFLMIKKLYLDDTNLSEKAIANIFRIFPNLEEVNLSANDEVANWILQLSDYVKFLTIKSLCLQASGLSAEAIARIFKIFPNLEEVDLSYNDEALNGILELQDDVKFLIMKKLSLYNVGLSVEAIAKIFKIFPNLSAECVDSLRSLIKKPAEILGGIDDIELIEPIINNTEIINNAGLFEQSTSAKIIMLLPVIICGLIIFNLNSVEIISGNVDQYIAATVELFMGMRLNN